MNANPARRGHPRIARPPGGNAGPVRIVVLGRVAVVEPANRNTLAPELTSRYTDYRSGGLRGLEPFEVVEEHFRYDATDRMWIFAGLVPRAESHLVRLGHSVEVTDRTPPRPRTRFDPARLGDGVPEVAAFARAVASRRRGLIVAPREEHAALIAAVMLAFPEASVTVAAATRREARRLGYQLRRLVGEPVEVLTGQFFHSDRRLRICTPGSLDEREADILLFAEARQALHVRLADLFGRLVNQHVLGFTTTTAGWGRRSRLAIEGLIGPVIHEVSKAAPRAGVTVLVADTPWAPPPGKVAGLERKRRTIWHADRRNGVVAEVAKALARGDRATLGGHGLLLGEGADPLGGADRVPRVAVLVESPEHARELARRLPGWSILLGSAEPPAGGGLWNGPSILTLVHAHRHKRLDLDVLVRADGAAGGLDLPGFPPRLGDAEDGQVVLVDFDDDFDRDADKATAGRLRAYEVRGWSVLGPARRGGRR